MCQLNNFEVKTVVPLIIVELLVDHERVLD